MTSASPRGMQPVLTRFLARHLWSGPPQRTLASAVEHQTRVYTRAVLLVRVFYAVSVLWAVQSINQWPRYQRLTSATPLWPARWWFDQFDVRTSVDIIFWLYVGAAVLVLALPDRRWARALYALGLLQYMAFVNGFDKINHSQHAWLFVSVILILLPRRPWTAGRRIADRQLFITVFWAAQVVVLFFYSLTGAWKILFAVNALAHGRLSAFNLSGFSYIVGDRLLTTNQDAVLGHFFTHNELVGWLLFSGTMYLETFSIFIAFRPRLHRWWGVALIAFHLGTQLAMGFTFGENIVLVGLLFVCSPWAPDRLELKRTLLDLPVIHLVAGWRRSRRRARNQPRSEIAEPR